MVRKNSNRILDKHIVVLMLIITSLFVIIYHEFMFDSHNYVVVFDAFYQFTSYFAAIGRLLRSGQLPEWSFQIGIGGVFNLESLTDIFNLLLAMIGNESAIIYFELLKVYLSAFFCYKYLEKLDFDANICIYGSVSYSFCGIMIIRSAWYSYSTEMMYFAMILYACELFFQKQKSGLLILSIVMYWGAGNIHRVFLSSVFLLAYLFTRYYIVGGYDLKKCFMDSIKVYFLTLLLSAVFLIPSIVSTLNAGRLSNQINRMKIGQWLPDADRVLAVICGFLSESLAGLCNESSFQPDGLDGPLFYVGIVNIFLIFIGIKWASKKIKKVSCFVMVFMILYLFCPNVNYLYNLGISNKYYKLFTIWMVMFLVVLACLGVKNIIFQIENRNNTLILAICFILESVLTYIAIINTYFKEHIVGGIAMYCMLLVVLYSVLFICIKSVSNIVFFLLPCLMTEYMFMAYPTVEKYVGYSEILANQYDSSLNDICDELYRENDFFRVDFKGKTTEALKYNFYGTSYWSTYMGRSYLDFLSNTTRDYTDKINRNDGVVEDPLLEQLLGVKYKIDPNGRRESANYILYKQYGYYDIFYNPYAYDLITVFDKYMYEEEYNKKNVNQKQLSLLDTLVIKSDSKTGSMQHDDSEKKLEGEEILPRLNTWADVVTMSETDYEFIVKDNADLQFIFDKAYAGEYIVNFVMTGESNTDIELLYKKGEDEISIGKALVSETGEQNTFSINEGEIDYLIIRINQPGKYKINNFMMEIQNIYSHLTVVNNPRKSNFEIMSFENNHVIGQLESYVDGKAMISVPCEKGWSLYVDGVKTDIEKVDFGLMAFDCNAGNHIVELVYKRPGLRLGIMVSFTTLIICAGYSVWLKRKNAKGQMEA